MEVGFTLLAEEPPVWGGSPLRIHCTSVELVSR